MIDIEALGGLERIKMVIEHSHEFADVDVTVSHAVELACEDLGIDDEEWIEEYIYLASLYHEISVMGYWQVTLRALKANGRLQQVRDLMEYMK